MDEDTIKNIQLSYFLDYSKKEKIDSNLVNLFRLAARLEKDSRKFLWNTEASLKFRNLIDLDVEGFINKLAIVDRNLIFINNIWRPIFNEDIDAVEKYLFDEGKNAVKGIDDARIIWSLVKNNNFNEIRLSDKDTKFKDEKNITEYLKQLKFDLDNLIEIRNKLDEIFNENDDNGALIALKEMQAYLNDISLDITLKWTLNDKIKENLALLG